MRKQTIKKEMKSYSIVSTKREGGGGGGGLRHARESPEAGLTKKASPRRQILWRPEARGARRRARGNE